MADENKIVYLPQLKHYDTKIKKYIGDADAAVEQKVTALAGKAVQSVEVTGADETTAFSATIAGTKLTLDTTVLDGALDNLNELINDKTIVKSVEATGATASIANNKLTINVPTPEQYSLPKATVTTLGGVYGLVEDVIPDSDIVYGAVKSAPNAGMYVNDLHDINYAMFDGATLNKIDDGEQALVATKTNAANLTQEIADRKAADELKADKATVEALTTTVNGKANAADVYAKTETYSQAEVDNKVAAALTSAIVPKGSTAFASLPTPAKANLGFMYNVTDAFTTTDSFVEGAGKVYAAGANVYVVDAGSGAYKFDVFMGFVDLTPYQLKADMPAAATDADIDAMFA